MASLQFHYCVHFLSPRLHRRCSVISTSRRRPPSSLFSRKIKLLSFRESFRGLDGACSFRCFAGTGMPNSIVGEAEEERPPFDINLAVILAGFAFEAYATPSENVGRREVDAAGCKTVYLSESFVRGIYDGQLFVKLKRGVNLPAMDPWGTSDPYVVLDLNGQVAKSKIKWGTKEPKWNEDFIFNIKQPPAKNLQVAAWDANLVTPHKRMGNAGVGLDCICDGNLHEVLVELEGMGGGGKIELEIRYKCFEEIEEEKKWWKIPFLSEFLRRNEFESVLRKLVESEAVPARQFVEYAFGQLKWLNDGPLKNVKFLRNNKEESESDEKSGYYSLVTDLLSGRTSSDNTSDQHYCTDLSSSGELSEENYGDSDVPASEVEVQNDRRLQTEKTFWSNFAEEVNHNIVQKLGLSSLDKFKWDGLDTLKQIGLQSRKIAEAAYIESGLATAIQEVDDDKANIQHAISTTKSSLPDVKKATEELVRQTDNVLGAFMVLKAAMPELHKDTVGKGKDKNKADSFSRRVDASGSSKSEELSELVNGAALDEKKPEEMKALFSSAESAMEAWAMLATALGHPSFIKSEFEKICFLDNDITDTQVAIWRDLMRKRLVIAFRGTEQSKWKDLQTDLMLVPAGLNPERIGGDFKQEVQVHSGFLSAYDSVRIRIISLLKLAIGYIDNVAEPPYKWHVYVTGHSLGGALATLLTLELASSQLAKRGIITVTMYNFGSPRVGNKRFSEVYNQKVRDSWRVVNHRDIIPTVPRLMGYCHVAQPVYLAAGDLKETLENVELQKDGYEGDVIGEATPDILFSEFMKGEKELIEKILQTEINIFNAIRDGTALMQHMEDFYYITLLENVRSYYQTVGKLEDDVMAAVESVREA